MRTCFASQTSYIDKATMELSRTFLWVACGPDVGLIMMVVQLAPAPVVHASVGPACSPC